MRRPPSGWPIGRTSDRQPSVEGVVGHEMRGLVPEERPVVPQALVEEALPGVCGQVHPRRQADHRTGLNTSTRKSPMEGRNGGRVLRWRHGRASGARAANGVRRCGQSVMNALRRRLEPVQAVKGVYRYGQGLRWATAFHGPARCVANGVCRCGQSVVNALRRRLEPAQVAKGVYRCGHRLRWATAFHGPARPVANGVCGCGQTL